MWRWLGPAKLLAARIQDEQLQAKRLYPNRFQGYDATYTGPNQCKFTFGGSNGGWGAPGPVRAWKVKTKLFGTVILEEYENEAGGSNYLVASATNTPYFKSYP